MKYVGKSATGGNVFMKAVPLKWRQVGSGRYEATAPNGIYQVENEVSETTGKRRWVCRLDGDSFESGKTKEEAMRWCQNSSEGEWGKSKSQYDNYSKQELAKMDDDLLKQWGQERRASQGTGLRADTARAAVAEIERQRKEIQAAWSRKSLEFNKWIGYSRGTDYTG